MKAGLDTVPTFRRWLLKTLPKSSNVGIDPYLIKSREFQDLNEFLEANGHKLVGVTNLVDVVWKNRPELKLNELEPIEQPLSGMCLRMRERTFENFPDLILIKFDFIYCHWLNHFGRGEKNFQFVCGWILSIHDRTFKYFRHPPSPSMSIRCV